MPADRDAGPALLYFCTGLASGLVIGLAAGVVLYPRTMRWNAGLGLAPWPFRQSQSQAQAALESLRRYG